MFLEHIKDLTESFIKLDKKIGFVGLIKYSLLILVIFCIFNFKAVIKGGIEIVNDIQEEIHKEKVEKRDQLLAEMIPLLTEFRAELEADRVLYFEYHNTKENLVGIPFKFVDLVLQNNRYGVQPIPSPIYREISAGVLTDVYEIIKDGKSIYCEGKDDTKFKIEHPGAYQLFINDLDGSSHQLYISLPGINQPIGLIVIEWIDKPTEDPEEIKKIYRSYIPRINGLILSKQ